MFINLFNVQIFGTYFISVVLLWISWSLVVVINRQMRRRLSLGKFDICPERLKICMSAVVCMYALRFSLCLSWMLTWLRQRQDPPRKQDFHFTQNDRKTLKTITMDIRGLWDPAHTTGLVFLNAKERET